MTTPQGAIFIEGARHHLFFEYRVDDAEAFRACWPSRVKSVA